MAKGEAMSARQPREIPVCEGAHVPAIIHRTGGASATLINVCAQCGRQIRNIGDNGHEMWVIDLERERRANATDANAKGTS